MKTSTLKALLFYSCLLSNALYAQDDLLKDSIEDILSKKSEIKADVGSRDGARNYLESNAPIDIITAAQIEQSGLTSLVDVLRYFVAGFNAPETSIADGSDHVRAFTFRGMSPDQILVLINGKRLHTSSLLHVNGTVGRGSSHADLDTIALKSIQRVEILRDGAAAQYGSDAISGVINIILKGIGQKNVLSVHAGGRKEGDGKQLQADAFISMPLEYDGFFNITLDVKDQESTQRAGTDNRVSPARITTRVGIPESRSYKGMIYTEMPQSEDINLYAQVLLNYRESQASAFFRDTNSSNPIYPNGFLPLITSKIFDYSAIFGVKGEFSDKTTWDFSNVTGSQDINYYVNDSMNYDLDSASPTSFYNGGINFFQNTTTLDFKKSDSVFKVAGGLEFRYENYSISAGDSTSYSGTSGSQGFSGYTPDNAVNESRSSYALYVDSIYDFSDDFMFEVALRYEEYSDFGESTNGKLALSYDLTPQLMLRSSGSTAFRAPSLAQTNYSQTSSYVDNNNQLSRQGTFRNSHEVSQSLGAKELKSERSQHLTMGSVYQPNKNTSFSIDYFFIHVNDKILLTPELSATTTQQQAIFVQYGITKARYFANAASTDTQGVDVKLNHTKEFSSSSQVDVGIWIHYSENKFNDQVNGNDPAEEATTKVLFEDAQPKSSIKFLVDYQYQKITTALNLTRYGSYAQSIDGVSYTFDPAWTTDLDVSYNFSKTFKASIGGNNIFDTLPNKWKGLSGDFYGNDGIKQYSRYSPFGYSGAYYYLRLSAEF